MGRTEIEMDLTNDDFVRALLDAMEATPENQDAAYTTAELKEMLPHVGTTKLRKTLGKLKADGVIKLVTVMRSSITEVIKPVPAWVLVDATETEKDND